MEVSRSALCRWVYEIAAELLSGDEMIHALDKQQPITEAHSDEMLARMLGAGLPLGAFCIDGCTA